ncbi:MAG: hypothetical protein HC871_10440 [Rhizobiales bacterium]|nr:hypothetical protein [Hyphomicrobiales bacterium]
MYTRVRVSAERRASETRFRTRETVVCETPAAMATSIIVGPRERLGGRSSPPASGGVFLAFIASLIDRIPAGLLIYYH